MNTGVEMDMDMEMDTDISRNWNKFDLFRCFENVSNRIEIKKIGVSKQTDTKITHFHVMDMVWRPQMGGAVAVNPPTCVTNKSANPVDREI